ncbi:cell division protein FtsA [Candidatus Pelagibacter sp.]|jgi:cell division protein FtsA|nr:cell division protein FtsA [Candidatus Pelagibacter sp.]
MNNEYFQTIFDCGFSKIRAGLFNTNNHEEVFYTESEFFTDRSNLELKIQKIITSLEKDSNEYIDNISLMLDSPNMISVGISLSKKLDGSDLKKTNIQFLVQEAKQQILKHYVNYNIAHIIINNYKIDGVDYSYLPDEIKCDFISLDIFFICLPTDLVLYFKNIFSKSNILVNQIICSSYAKSINYKNHLKLTGHVSFIDVGFSRASITSYFNDKIISLNVLPIGGNHITKDISQVLKIDLKKSEQIKRNFVQNIKVSNNENIEIDLIEKIIFARTEEILELCAKSIESNSYSSDNFKMVLTGEGSKILDNLHKDKIFFSNDIDFLEETLEDICQSGFKFVIGPNKQEVVVIPKKQIKKGFFEKFFHFFK